MLLASASVGFAASRRSRKSAVGDDASWNPCLSSRLGFVDVAKLEFTFAFALTAVCATGALAQSLQPPQGRPVMAKDIIGKKICWGTAIGASMPPTAITQTIGAAIVATNGRSLSPA
jgi:hypothetical protein